MANQLKVAVMHAIEVLLERGWSQRRIAGALDAVPIGCPSRKLRTCCATTTYGVRRFYAREVP